MLVSKFDGYLIAKSPIHHGGNEKTGSTPILRSVYIYTDDGEVQMPYISGNGIRGKLRRVMMLDFLKNIDVSPEDLSLKLYHSLFTGGVLEQPDDEKDSGVVDLELRKNIKSFIVPVALFGSAFGNQMIPGKLKVGNAFPVCREYYNFLPDFLKNDERAQKPVRIFTDEVFQTRRDDLKAEREKNEQAVQMKVDFECFIPGTKFYHWFALEYPTELEVSCFRRMIDLFRNDPYVGGRSGSGCGEVEFYYENVDSLSSEMYMQYIRDNKDRIMEIIKDVEKKM